VENVNKLLDLLELRMLQLVKLYQILVYILLSWLCHWHVHFKTGLPLLFKLSERSFLVEIC
jgi:hypothetical protein